MIDRATPSESENELSEIVDSFVIESRELLADCYRYLNRWSTDGDAGDSMADLARALHTIKGTASFLNLEAIVARAHALEETLRAFGCDQSTVTVDAVGELSDHLDQLAIDVSLVGEIRPENVPHRPFTEVAVAAYCQALAGYVERIAAECSINAALSVSVRPDDLPYQLVQPLSSAILHLLRNACAHGIESAGLRVAAGKPATGVISLSIELDDQQLTVRVADDGRGLDAKAISAAAREFGEAATGPMTAEEQIILPGFSTALSAGPLAGRGYGLDVVRRSAEALGGRLVVEGRQGHGFAAVVTIPQIR